MGKFLLNLKKHKKIIGIFSLSTIIFGATGTSISFAVKANETSISRATKLSEEFYENINWNDVESLRKELVSSYEEKLNNDAEYEDLRNDPNHTVSEYVYNFNNFLKYEVLNQKTKNYSPKIVYEHLQEIANEYKLNVLDWEYAINYSQLLIENSEKEINALSNLTTEQKKEINKSTTDKIEISFSEARSNGWTALEFINHFMKLMNSSITSQRNEFVEKAITNNKLLEFLASQHLCANEQVLPNKLQINLKKIPLNTNVTYLLPYLFKFNGYPVTEHLIEGYKLGLSVKANEQENAFKRNFIFVFSLIKENSEFFVEPPAQQELKNISISESNEIENKAIFENVFATAFVAPKRSSVGSEPLAYTDFINEIKDQKTNIPFKTLIKIFDFNIDPEYEQFFCNDSNELTPTESKYRIFGKLESQNDDKKTCSISIDIRNTAENISFYDVFQDKIAVPKFDDIQLGLSEDEQWEAIQFISAKLFKTVENTMVLETMFSSTTPEINSSVHKKRNFNIAYIAIEWTALIYYTAMAIIQWINVVLTFGGCLWSAIGYTACVIATTVSLVFLAIEERDTVDTCKDLDKITKDENFHDVYVKWTSNTPESIKEEYYDFTQQVYSFFKGLKTFDYETKHFDKNELIDLFGGENHSIYFASKKIFSFWDIFLAKFLAIEQCEKFFGLALALDTDPEQDLKYVSAYKLFFDNFIRIVDTTFIAIGSLVEFFNDGAMALSTVFYSHIIRSITANVGQLSSRGILWFQDGIKSYNALKQGFWSTFWQLTKQHGIKAAWRTTIDFHFGNKFWNQKVTLTPNQYDIITQNPNFLQEEGSVAKFFKIYGAHRRILDSELLCAELIQSPYIIFFEISLGILQLAMAVVSMSCF